MIKALIQQGHKVRGTVRDASKAEVVKSLGAEVFEVKDMSDASALEQSLKAGGVKLLSLNQEHCYYVQLADGAKPLTAEERQRLMWLFSETFEPQNLDDKTKLATPATGAAGGGRVTYPSRCDSAPQRVVVPPSRDNAARGACVTPRRARDSAPPRFAC